MKVLVADDEVMSRRLIESSVRRWGYDVVVAADGLEAAHIMRQPDAPRLAILDWLMPGLDGIQLCRDLRSNQENDLYTYLLLLTVKHTTDEIIQGLESGADDYIIKPFDPRELKVRLRAGKRILYLMEQLTAARETMRDLASRDSLTKLWNHNSIIQVLQDEIARAKRLELSVGVILIDLDHFKVINDTHGHLAGDHVLRAAAKAMETGVRPYDAVGRFGGEEFMIVLGGCDAINAIGHAERIRHALGRLEVRTPEGIIRFTASIGVTVVGPGGYADEQVAMRTADSALYAAKQSGRNQVRFQPLLQQFANA